MRFVVKTGGAESARCGLMHFGSGMPALDTPCLLIPTRRGLPSFIAPDLLAELHPDARAFQVNPVHFVEGPPLAVIRELGGGQQMLNLRDRILVSSPRDSVVSEPDGEGNTKAGAAYDTSSGRRVVGPAKYMELVNALKPNLWASVADELPAWSTRKRNKLSVDRTLQWLDQCLSLQSAEVKGFGSIVGGSNLDERKRSASETAKRNVSGFYIGGMGLGESPEDREALLQTVIKCLPPELPRLVSGLGLPEEILQAVSTGVDMFDSIYPHTLTKEGYGLTFPLSMEDKTWKKFSIEDGAGIGEDFTKINLRSATYRSDTTPIKQGCSCYTCKKHTRAYLNHLLNTHEMIAQTLLDMHNLHHYLSFFQAIRAAICGSYFEDFHSWYLGQRRYSDSNEEIFAAV